MLGRGSIDALYILKRHEEDQSMDKKLCKCFVDIEKLFDRVPKKVIEGSMQQTGLLEMLMKAVVSLYQRVKRRVPVGLGLSAEFFVKVDVHQDQCCHPYYLQL